jgi:hypothetical protein
MPVPIWKDYEVGFGNIVETDYTISTGGNVIYSGHAVRRPEQTQLTVRINDICADFLAHAVPSIASATSVSDPSATTFVVKDGGGTTVDTVEFLADWSFDYDHVVTSLADPVNGRVSAAQSLIVSVYSSSAVSATLRYAGGSTDTVTIASSGGPVQVVSIPLSSYDGLASVTVAGKTYKVVPACDRFALVYVNAFDGWDSLLMDGRPSEMDAYTRNVMKQRYNNAVRSERGTVEYLNEVTKRWTLRTGWLTDEQAARMHHVAGSVAVYLYDITDNALIPVVITDEQCEYKTYRGNGGRMVNYTIGVEVAQDMLRR